MDEGTARSGTATVVFTDLVGSTELMARLGEPAATDLRRRHDEALAKAVEVHGGTVVKGLGDGVMATFPGARDAVAASAGMQRAIARLSKRTEVELAIRVGMSVGDVAWEHGDCFGDAVVEASRLCDAASGGQILCSDLVRALARGGTELELVPLGELELKGLRHPVAICELPWSEEVVAAAPVPAVLRTRTPFPFVGRAREWEVLEGAWKLAVASESSTVLLAGEPGVGKTRLAGELAKRVVDEGGLALAGRCDEEMGVPFQPFVEALRHFVDHVLVAGHDAAADGMADRLGRYGGDLVRIVPDLGERVPGLPRALRADEESERYRLFDAVASWLVAASAEQPVLLVVDDLHWAARPTLLMLRHLLRSVRSAEESRLLVVITYRDTDVDRSHPLGEMLADLRREAGAERALLRGLGSDDVRVLVEAAAGHELEDRAGELVEALHAETDGNPLFVEEVLAHLIETGTIYRGGDGRWASDVESIEELGIPEGLRDVIGRRLSGLSEACGALLGRAAVLGPEFDPAALASMVGSDVVDPLDEAERVGLIAEAGGSGGRYVFTHALVRQTLVEELSLARRQQYHLAAAQALEAGGGPPAAVAVQYRQAGAAADPEVAVAASVEAADDARRRLAYEEASAHWEAGLDLLEVRGGDPELKARLLALLGDAMYAVGVGTDWERGLEQLERARRLYEELGNDDEAAKLRSRIGRSLSTFPGRLDIPRALEHFKAAAGVLRRHPDSVAAGWVDLGFASAAIFRARPGDGLDAAGRALELGRRINHAGLVSTALTLGGVHRLGLGEIGAAFAAQEEAYEYAVEVGHPVLTFVVTFDAGFACAHALGDPLEAIRWAEREMGSGRLDQTPGLWTTLREWSIDARYEAGALADARRARSEVAVTPHFRFRAAVLEGEWDGVEGEGEEVVAQHLAAGSTVDAVTTLHTLGCALRWSGRLEVAHEQMRRAWRLLEPTDQLAGKLNFVQPQLAFLAAKLGRRHEAGEHLEACRSVVAGGEDWRGRVADVEMAEGVAAEHPSDAEAHLERAVEVARRFHRPFVEAEALQEWGLRTGRVDRSDGALEIYDRIDASEAWKERGRRLRAEATG